MNIVNGIYYDLCDTVKVVGIIPITFNEKLNLDNHDLLIVEDDDTHELRLALALNKDKVL